MPSILTVTFNPCIDKSTTIPALAPEKKLRCTEPKFEPGGGGVNVARAIKKLGGEATAIYPSGGYSGRFLNELLRQEEVPIKTFEIKHHTRENLIVLDTSTNQQYRFGMPGSELFESEWQECLRLIKEDQEVQYIVASGSLPPGVPNNIYAQIASIAKKKNARLIVDTSGEALREAVKEGVYLLKPNLAELSQLVGEDEINAEFIDDAAREIIAKGECEIIITSMGQSGAMLVTKDEVFQVTPPVVKRRSTVGAGDSMVAAVVLGLSKGWEIMEALKYGVAAGTAATLNPGTELCRLEDVERLFRIISKNYKAAHL